MGGRAVLPLAVALNSKDQRQLRSVALVLGDLGDDRALPALLRAQARTDLEDTSKAILPYMAALLIGILMLAYVPWFSTVLLNLLGR